MSPHKWRGLSAGPGGDWGAGKTQGRGLREGWVILVDLDRAGREGQIRERDDGYSQHWKELVCPLTVERASKEAGHIFGFSFTSIQE